MFDKKKYYLKTGAIALSAVLACSVAGGLVYTKNAAAAETSNAGTILTLASTKDSEGSSSKSTSAKTSDGALHKEETVYVMSAADGSVREIKVSNWIENPGKEASIKDVSTLSDITEVKDNESYTQEGENYTWDAQGNDIYYQGTSNKELPVKISASYKLDGKDISPEELAGKSGHVVIRYEFENNQTAKITVNGKEETVNVPFMAVSAMILDNSHFQDITVSSGKIINDGNRSIVAGVSLPGLADSLFSAEHEEDKEKLMDKTAIFNNFVEVEADVEDFTMEDTYVYVSNDLFDEFTLDGSDDLTDITDSVGELTDAADALEDGSKTLYDGLSTLYSKSGDLSRGINSLADGSSALAEGADTLKDGASSLSTGANALASGLATLTGQTSALTGGAQMIFQAILDTANTQLASNEQLAANGISVPTLTIENYNTVLTNLLSSFNADGLYDQVYGAVLAQVTAQVNEAYRNGVQAQVEAQVKSQVEEQVVATATGGALTVDQYHAILNGDVSGNDPAAQAMAQQLSAAVDAQMQSENIQNTIASTTDSIMQSESTQAAIQTQIGATMASEAITATIQDKVNEYGSQLQAGADAIISLKAQLDSVNTFYQGIIAYTAGVSTAYNGAGDLARGAASLANGATTLADGANTLNDGVGQLKDGSAALIDGVKQLKDGSKELAEGMQKFNEEGIQKISDLAGSDLTDVTDRLEGVLDTAKDYTNFSGISDNMTGNVKFIYKLDAID